VNQVEESDLDAPEKIRDDIRFRSDPFINIFSGQAPFLIPSPCQTPPAHRDLAIHKFYNITRMNFSEYVDGIIFSRIYGLIKIGAEKMNIGGEKTGI